MPGTLTTAIALAQGRRSLAAPRSLSRATTQLSTGGAGGGWVGSILAGEGGLVLSASEADWSASATAYRCVMTIAQNMASVPLVVVEGDEVNAEDPLALLFNDGFEGSQLSARVIRETLFARAELKGQAFAYLDRGATGTEPVQGVHPIYDTVKVVVEKDPVGRTYGTVAGYIVSRGGREIPLLPSEVLWLRYPDPFVPWGALAPWRSALYAMESDAYARLWQRSEFKNNARPSGVIGLGNVTPEVYEQALAAIRGRLDGPENASKTLVTNGTVAPQYARISLSPEEMSYLESRAANRTEIMLAFGLSPDLFLPGATFENRRQAKTAMWSDLLVPKLDVLSSEIDRQLVPETNRRAAWDLTDIEALRESQDAVVSRASSAMYPDIALVDEARAMLGWEPLPNGAGQFTLTAYRERARLNAQVEILSAAGGGIAAPARFVRVAGATRLIRRRSLAPACSSHPAPRVRASAEDAVLRAYARHERIGAREVGRLAARQEKAVLRALKQAERAGWTPAAYWAERGQHLSTRPLLAPDAALQLGAGADRRVAVIPIGIRAGVDQLFDPTYWRAETMRALESWLEGVWTEGGQRIAGQLGVSWDHLDPMVLEKMTARLGVLADLVTDTTRAALESQILQAGVDAGESIDDLADRLREVFADLAGWRGEMIARTETVGGFNAAAHETAKQTELVVNRRWLATADSRTRPSHRAALEDPAAWTLSGTEGTYPNGCRFPGDPTASPAETIACRCVELFGQEGDEL